MTKGKPPYDIWQKLAGTSPTKIRVRGGFTSKYGHLFDEGLKSWSRNQSMVFFLWKSKNVRYLRYMSISVRKYDDQPLSLAYTQWL